MNSCRRAPQMGRPLPCPHLGHPQVWTRWMLRLHQQLLAGCIFQMKSLYNCTFIRIMSISEELQNESDEHAVESVLRGLIRDVLRAEKEQLRHVFVGIRLCQPDR